MVSKNAALNVNMNATHGGLIVSYHDLMDYAELADKDVPCAIDPLDSYLTLYWDRKEPHLLVGFRIEGFHALFMRLKRERRVPDETPVHLTDILRYALALPNTDEPNRLPEIQRERFYAMAEDLAAEHAFHPEDCPATAPVTNHKLSKEEIREGWYLKRCGTRDIKVLKNEETRRILTGAK